MADIKIYGVLVNDTSEGIVTRSDQVFDKNFGKTQASINEELMDIANSVKDLTITYDDFVTETSKNAVKSSGVFKAIKDVSDHLPFIGSDGYVYVWDPALNDYKRSGTNLTGPAGETGGGIHLIFDAIVLTVDEFGVMSPSSPLRVRAIRQYGQTGLDEFTEGRIRWWYNDIEDEDKPDGESPVDEDGNGVSEVFIDIDPDHHEKVTVRLYLDQAATKLYDQQDVVILKHPTIYKLDLTNENSMVPMEDDEGNVKDEFLETTQAILYYGASQIPFNEIKYSIGENDHDGITTATINEEGIVTLKGWKTAWSNVSIKITAEYKGHIFYATYTIARVSGVAIYRLKPSVTGIKKKKDGTFNVDKLYINIMKVVGSNTGSMTEKVLDLAAEKLSVRYTYNNKVNSNSDIYTIDDIVNEGIPIKDEELPETLDGSLVSEVDVYLVKSGQALEDLDTFIDHETVPLVEDGDDGFNLMLTNENMTIAALADGTQVGQLMNTQGLLYKGIQNLSEKAKWTYKILSGSIKGSPRWHATIPGYLNLAGCEVDKNSDEVEIAVYAQYPSGTGETFQKTCTITKAKQGATGEAGYKSIIFCRTNTVPDTPLNGTTGGTYEKPVPTHDVTSNGESLGIKWHDGIPDGKEKIWSSSRYFSTYSIEGQKATTWTVPTVMSDTENMNIEFTWYDPYIGDPDSDPDFWFDPDKDAEVFQNHTMIYMATQRLENGVPVTHSNADGNETSWTIVRVLGEKGETALRSFVFTRCFDKPATPVGGTIENPIPDPEQGDGTIWYDGIPGGDPLLPVWGSLKTFSSIKHLETDWSEPQIMKDVPNEYDVQYSIKKERPEPPSNDYPSSGADWFDPEDPTATPEIMEQVMWMAQRWYSSDGWSPWDIIKVKGEDGKDGSKAIVRMRGDWRTKEEGGKIEYGEWILSGTSHMDTDNNGNPIEIEEQFQDLVSRKTNEVDQVFKCLKSHKKSDAYDPGYATYEWDEKKQADISTDGMWMRAEKYSFIATDLLYAKELIADVISANRTEIIGEVSGSWEKDYKEGGNSILTKVTTENGKIEFSYWDKSKNDWNLSVDIGYDFKDGCGVLRFYATDGVTPLYNLGPKGLSANSVSSPSVSTTTLNDYIWYTPLIVSCGYFMGRVDAGGNVTYIEKDPFYDSNSGTTITLSLNHDYYYPYMRFNPDLSSTGGQKIYDTYQLLIKKPKAGSFIPQLTLPFSIVDPVNLTNLDYGSSESVEYGGIKFGKGTIGYVCLDPGCNQLSFQKISYSWEKDNNIDYSFGALMPPVRRWTAITPIITDLHEINCNEFTYNSVGDKVQVWYNHQFTAQVPGNAGGEQIFAGRVNKGSDLGSSNYIMVYLNEDFIAYDFLGSLGEDLGSDYFINDLWNNHMAYDFIESGGKVEADLMSQESALSVLTEAIKIFCRLMQRFVGTGVACQITSSSSSSVSIDRGIQWILSQSSPSFPYEGASRNTLYLAKALIEEALSNCNKYYSTDPNAYDSGGYYYSGAVTLGYIFPEDKKFVFNDGKLSVSTRDSEKLSYCNITNGYNTYEVTSATGSAKSMYLLKEGQAEYNPGYLMVETVSSNLGFDRSGITYSGNNTYKLEMTRDVDDWKNGIHFRFKLTPVNYYTAWMEQAFMYDQSNSNYLMPDWYRYSGNYNQTAKRL